MGLKHIFIFLTGIDHNEHFLLGESENVLFESLRDINKMYLPHICYTYISFITDCILLYEYSRYAFKKLI